MMTPYISHLGEFCTVAIPAALVVLTLAALLLASFPPGDSLREDTLRYFARWWFAAAFSFIVLLVIAFITRSFLPPAAAATGSAVEATSQPLPAPDRFIPDPG